MNKKFTRTVDEMVQQEVYYRVSVLMTRLPELEPDNFLEEFIKYDDSPEVVEEYLKNDVSCTDLSNAMVEFRRILWRNQS